jgi:nitronate monooxygenase
MSAASQSLLELLGIDLPILQAPMAGISTPRMAAAVSNAGALGAIAVGATNAIGAKKVLDEVRTLTNRSINVNAFCHTPAKFDRDRESRFLERLRPSFGRFGKSPPRELHEIYRSFVEDDEMLALFIAAKPKSISFHFGLPSGDHIRALRDAGIFLLASATNLIEARAIENAGVHAVVAQGFEAGGHRGVFDPEAPDDCLGTIALTRLLVKSISIPVIAAGGIMDGSGIAAALRLGASAAQLGTAFVACDESDADDGYRAALTSDAAHHTTMTRVISGRPARCLANFFTNLGEEISAEEIPSYPIAYDAGKALNAAAKSAGEFGYGAQWAGQGAPLSRAMSAGDLVRVLAEEMGGEEVL